MSEIADLIEKNNMTKSFTEEVTSFKERELHDRYAAIYMDATYIPLKRKTVAKEAIHIAVGIPRIKGAMRLHQLNRSRFGKRF